MPTHQATAPPQPDKETRSRHRVIKTLSPGAPGTLHRAREHGDALVCVRIRSDARGKVRHTTIELLVDSRPIRPRKVRTVAIRVHPAERALIAMIRAAGANWDPQTRHWNLPQRVATILHLSDRVVRK